MADKKISQLTAAAALTGTEIVPIVQSGVTVSTTAQDIADLAPAPTAAYTVYTALLTPLPSPSAVVLDNTTGLTLVWSFNTFYRSTMTTLTGVDSTKVFVIGSSLVTNKGVSFLVIDTGSDTEVHMQENPSGPGFDGDTCFIEIRVYN